MECPERRACLRAALTVGAKGEGRGPTGYEMRTPRAKRTFRKHLSRARSHGICNSSYRNKEKKKLTQEELVARSTGDGSHRSRFKY